MALEEENHRRQLVDAQEEQKQRMSKLEKQVLRSSFHNAVLFRNVIRAANGSFHIYSFVGILLQLELA